MNQPINRIWSTLKNKPLLSAGIGLGAVLLAGTGLSRFLRPPFPNTRKMDLDEENAWTETQLLNRRR